MRILLILPLVLGLFTQALAADCQALKDPRARVSDPEQLISDDQFQKKAEKNTANFGFFIFAWGNVQQLCSLVEASAQNYCLQKSAGILNEAMSCLDQKLFVHETRPLVWSILRNQELESLITESLYKKANSPEEKEILKNIWQKYYVLVLPAEIPTPIGLTKKWRIEDLKHMEKSFEKLMSAVSNAVGKENAVFYSHIWGAGGTLARLGTLSVSGQFGEVYNTHPMQINVVIDVLKERKSTTQIAQQLAHENAHSNDHLRGRLLTGQLASWSETGMAQIFQMCGLPARYNTSLMPCYQKKSQWFNFHSTSYPARRSAEFYTKMVDQWVRENLKLNSKKPYRCQNSQTLSLWNEMEVNLLGNVISKSCY